MGFNMDQYVKTLGNDSEDKIKVPFSASHFESALNSANDQLMQRYIATEECFHKFTGRSGPLRPRTDCQSAIGYGQWIPGEMIYEKLNKDSELGLEERLNKIIQQDAMQRKLNKIFQFQNSFLN